LLERARASYASLRRNPREESRRMFVCSVWTPLKAVFTSDGETVTVP
jgi:hypothetical protein